MNWSAGFFACGVLTLILATTTLPIKKYPDIYVAVSGDDTGPGTIEQPLRTLQHAAEIAKPGVTVNVRGGIYCQQFAIRVSGNAKNGFITFQSAKGEQAVLDGACLTPFEGASSMVELRNVNYVRVQNLEIRNYRTSSNISVPWGIRVFGKGSHLELLQNNVHHIEQNAPARSGEGANALGIGVYGTDAKTPISDLVIDGNEVHHLKTGLSESLVVNGNVSGFRITRNVVHDNNNIGIDVIGFEGTAPDPSVDRARDGLVSENSVYNITSKENLGNRGDADGIYVDGGTRILIERNIIHDTDYGIDLESEHLGGSTSQVLARNNLIYSCRSAGFGIGGYDLKRGGTEDTIIVNNTLYQNDTLGTGTGEFLMMFHMRNNIFQNNIIYVGPQGKVFSSRSGRMNGEPTVVMDYNLYFFPDGSKKAKWTYDNMEFANFEDYVRATGNDRNSLFEDPRFVDPASENFHLRPDSPARAVGKNLGVQLTGEKDLDGHPRVRESKIDIGCFETPI